MRGDAPCCLAVRRGRASSPAGYARVAEAATSRRRPTTCPLTAVGAQCAEHPVVAGSSHRWRRASSPCRSDGRRRTGPGRCARTAYQAARAEAVRDELARLPLSRLREMTKVQLRLGPLEAVGYTTVASVVGARVGRLQVIDGSGPTAPPWSLPPPAHSAGRSAMPSTVAAAVASPCARQSTRRAAGPHRTRARVLRPSSGPVPGIVFVPPTTPCLPGPRRAQPRRPCVTWTTTQRGVDQPRASPRRVRCRRDHRLERCRQRALEPCLRRRLRRRCRPDRLPGRSHCSNSARSGEPARPPPTYRQVTQPAR
jgi:hypothetical protein